MDWGSIKKKSEFIQFACFYTLRDLETSFQTKLLCRKQSWPLPLLFQTFGQLGFGALKRFLEKDTVVVTFQCSSKYYPSLLSRGRKSSLSCVLTLQSTGSGCMCGFWKTVLWSIGDVCHRQSSGELWWNSWVFAISGYSYGLLYHRCFRKRRTSGEGAAHLSMMCLTPCHRDTTRQSFNSRKFPRQTWHRNALLGDISLPPLDM